MTKSEQLGTIGAAYDTEDAEQEARVTAVSEQLADALDRNAILTEKLAEYETPPEPPAPPPEPKAATPVGSSLHRESGETLQSAFDRRTKNWGAAPEMVRIFFEGMPVGWPQFGSANSLVTFKPPSVAGFGRGDYDAQTTTWLNSLPRDKKVRRVGIFHEREDDIEAGRFSKADAKAMDAKLAELIADANARNGTRVTFGIVLMGWTLDARSGRTFADYMPSSDAGWNYDWIGWDAYSGDSPSNDLPDLAWTKELYGRCAKATRDQGVPNWYVCETGTRNHAGDSAAAYDGRQADWINGAAQVARELGCKGWMYFDSTVGGDFRIKGPKGFAAMANQIGK